MREIGSFEAKTHLSELLAAVERGESFTITRRGKPVAVLQPVADAPTRRAEAIARIEALRKRIPGSFTTEEILSARDEGRK